MRAHPTILDVAQSAGVSKSTVSNVIRGARNVSPETRRRVLETAALLGYRPNAVARDLVRRRTSTLGLVVGDLANPFYSELAKLIERRATAAGFATMICNTDGRHESEQARVESLLEHRAAGVLMLQFSGERALLDELAAAAVPVVVVTCWEERTDCVCVDDVRGAALAVGHLLALGHRQVGYLSSGLVEPVTERRRFEGYRQALSAAGILVADPLVVRVEQPAYLGSDGSMLAALDRLLALPDAPTALFCTNDLLAVEVVETLERLGLRVPDAVSVAGFDGIALAGLVRVSLTTVAQPREELARLAVELVVDRIEGRSRETRRITLEPSLLARGSTASPP